MKESSNDLKNFCSLKETIIRVSRFEREKLKNPEFSTSLPEELRIQLTTQCNLRCKHCFQWNNGGYYKMEMNRDYDKYELSFKILEKLLKQTYMPKISIYLWGGEPLIYSYWDSMIELLKNDDRKKVISTNGIHVNRKIDTLNKISENLEVVFSLDGLKNEHEYLRGKHTFNKLIDNIHLLVREKKEERYKGQITINCSINNELIPKLSHFVNFCNTLHINKLILGFPWYINSQTCLEMDEYYMKNFSWLNGKTKFKSWHCFNYHIDESLYPILENEVRKIISQHYNFILRFHPSINNDLQLILRGDVFKNTKKANCLAPSCRMAVWANANVSFCGDFPEFCIDSLENSDLETIWKGERFNKVRKIFNSNPKPSSLCQRCRFISNNLT